MKTKEFILELPLSSIISKYISLNQNGKTLKGLCPFHRDTKPSLKVHDEKGIYKCFVCGAGGDVFNFVMNYRNLSFSEALKEIAEGMGIPFEGINNLEYFEEKAALEMTNKAKELFIKIAEDSNEFKEFLKSRKISTVTAKSLSLGYGGDTDIITELLRGDEVNIKLAIDLGLIRRNQNGFEDNFKNRFIFPIFNEKGSCVGFCGRSTLEDQTPKYLNSKESIVFKKSELLYGLNFSKEEIQKQSSVLVVEGFMDYVALFEHGIKNAVACMGTALSESNIERLHELASEIVLGLDSDDAGVGAMKRMNKIMLKKGIVPYSISYAPFKDADEFLNSSFTSSKELQRIICSSKTILDQEIENYIHLNKSTSIEKKLHNLKSLFGLVSDLGNNLSAKERIIHYSKELGILSGSEEILKEYEKSLEKKLWIPIISISDANNSDSIYGIQIKSLLLNKKIKEIRFF